MSEEIVVPKNFGSQKDFRGPKKFKLPPSCKLELARFSAKLKIQEGAEVGNTNVRYLRLKLQYHNGWGQTNTKYVLMGGDGLS